MPFSPKGTLWALLISNFLLGLSPLHGQTYLWTGNTNNAWAVTSNWAPAGDPNGTNHIAQFGATSVNTAPNVPGAGRDLARLEFLTGAVAHTLGGGAINLYGSGGTGLLNNATTGQSIANTLSLQANQTWQLNSGTLTHSGPLNFNAYNLTLNGAGTGSFSGNWNANDSLITRSGSGNTTIAGSVFGTASTIFRHEGSGVASVTGGAFQVNGQIRNGRVDVNTTTNQAFFHGLTIGGFGNPAEVRLLNNNRIFASLTPDVLQEGILNLNNFNQTFAGLTMTAGTVTTGTGTLTLSSGGGGVTTTADADPSTISGRISLPGFTTPFTIANGSASQDLILNAQIQAGSGRIVKQGAGRMAVTGNNSGWSVGDAANPAWQLENGTVEIMADNNLGAGTNRVRLRNGSTLRVDGTFTSNTNRIYQFDTGGGQIDVTSGNTWTIADNTRLIGSGSLTKIGVGTLQVTANSQPFSGGLIINEGTFHALIGSTYTWPATGNSPGGSGAITVDGSSSLLHFQTTGTNNLAFDRPATIDNGGTIRLTPGNRITSQAGTVTFGSGGGLLHFNGNAQATAVNALTNADTATPGIVRYGHMITGTGYGGWTGGQGLQVNGGLNAGASDDTIRFELTNGALVEQSQNAFAGTLVIRGVNGGDITVNSTSTDIGRWALVANGTYTYAGGLFIEDAVQFTIFNGIRTVNSNITVREDGAVGFQGRSTGSANLHDLILGSSVNGIDLTVEKGAKANLDIRYRNDNASDVNTGGIVLNARSVLEAGGTLEFTHSNTTSPGNISRIQVNGNLVGQGTLNDESVILLNTPVANGDFTGSGSPTPGYTAGTTYFSNGVNLIVDSTDTSCANTNGLRIQGTATRVNTLANDARLSSVSGAGGTLTLAYTDAGSRTLTSAANPSSAVNVKLGFEGHGSGTATINITGDISNFRGIVVKDNATVTVSGSQSATQSCGYIVQTGGTLLLGASDVIANGTPMRLDGGTFNTQGYSDTLGTLTLTANSTINLGAGASILQFADSSSASWVGSATLSITNWSGEPYWGGGTDRIYIGTSSSGLTAGQLSQIKFVDPFGLPAGVYDAMILSTGEIVPVPEPAAIFAAIALLGFAVWRERKHWCNPLKKDAFGSQNSLGT